tara:strand:- start:645 stop:890 length:246 start_codon:yes stop_codon:yes gene_type:complete
VPHAYPFKGVASSVSDKRTCSVYDEVPEDTPDTGYPIFTDDAPQFIESLPDEDGMGCSDAGRGLLHKLQRLLFEEEDIRQG